MDERYCLMNKDKVLLTFACTSGALGSILLKEEACNVSAEELPIGFSSIHTWVEQRQAPKHREHIAELMRQCGCSRIDGFLKITHALSLNDTFWVKPIDSSFKWMCPCIETRSMTRSQRSLLRAAYTESSFLQLHQNLKRAVPMRNAGYGKRKEISSCTSVGVQAAGIQGWNLFLKPMPQRSPAGSADGMFRIPLSGIGEAWPLSARCLPVSRRALLRSIAVSRESIT